MMLLAFLDDHFKISHPKPVSSLRQFSDGYSERL